MNPIQLPPGTEIKISTFNGMIVTEIIPPKKKPKQAKK